MRTTSRLVASETAITARACRAPRGMNGRIASRRRRGWYLGNIHSVVSWIVTTDGHGVHHEATLLVKWQTSAATLDSCSGSSACIHTVLLMDVCVIGRTWSCWRELRW